MPVIPRSHLYTQTHTLAVYVTTLRQPRTRAPRCGLQPVISTSPPFPLDTSRLLKGSKMCERADVRCGGHYLSGEVLMEGHARTYGQAGRCARWTVWEDGVDTVLHQSDCLSGYFETAHPDLTVSVDEEDITALLPRHRVKVTMWQTINHSFQGILTLQKLM